MAYPQLVSTQAGTQAAGTQAGTDVLSLHPGRTVGLVGPAGFGLTRLGLTMLATPSRRGPVAFVDVRGWLCPMAAWESGIDPERLVVVRCSDPVTWGRVVTALLEGLQAVYAEVPPHIKETQLRTLAATVRSRQRSLVVRPVRGALPAGMAHLLLEARQVRWEGPDGGSGRLGRRRMVLAASGKAMRGMERTIEVEDDGTHAVRLVSGLGVAPTGIATG